MVPRCLWNLSKPWFVNFGDDAHQAVSVPILPLPPAGSLLDNSALLDRFLAYVADQKLELYPAQEEAILELYDGNNLILTTPTGSGKSLVAAALHYQSLAQGRRSVYTCPIKALVNEKWLALCRLFGPEKVGLSTGDASVNLGAPILCCTAEILANLALREGSGAQVDDVIMDEFHYYADADRGVAWQIPLLTLSKARFLLISATLGDPAFFQEALTRLNGLPTVVVTSSVRPVPLEYSYAETPLATTLEELVATRKTPVYVVHFTQSEAADSAQSFMSTNVCTREEKEKIAHALHGFKFASPFGPEVKRWIRHGIGIHHAGLLPKYRVLVEQLAQRGLLKVICGTDTLGVGINVPIRTVIFTQLCKYNGKKTTILNARDFHQISGRAGRKGFDDTGWVIAQAPAHAIENLLLEQKQAATGKKFVRRKPPEWNFVNWDKQTFHRLLQAVPERLTSQFKISHAMILNVLSRSSDGCRALQQLVAHSHEPPKAKQALRKRGWELFRALHEAEILQLIPQTIEGAKVRVNLELQDDFSMNQTLSLYLLDTLRQIDPKAPDYALVVLTLVESILEDPDPILRSQLRKVKDRAMAEMKAEGVPYEKRMEELERLEHPKPNRDFIYASFNAFAAEHPWIDRENIRPKSIAREMFEDFRSFADYIKIYDLERSEGILLRHLSSVYKVLAQTVPDASKNETIVEMEDFLAALLRQIDSSLLDEWEKLRDPNYLPPSDLPEVRPFGAEETRDITRDAKTFTAAVRLEIFTFLRHLIDGRIDAGLALVNGQPSAEAEPWTVLRVEKALDDYRLGHENIRLDPEARNLRHTYVNPSPDRRQWRVQQMLVDPAEANDWVAEFDVDLSLSREAGRPVLQLCRFSSLV